METVTLFSAEVSLAAGNTDIAVPEHFLSTSKLAETTQPEPEGHGQPRMLSAMCAWPNTSDEGGSRCGQYQPEWDMMCEELPGNRSPHADGGSDLKELYYQISRTMDLLNS